jgi:hypothetical protein
MIFNLILGIKNYLQIFVSFKLFFQIKENYKTPKAPARNCYSVTNNERTKVAVTKWTEKMITMAIHMMMEEVDAIEE